MVHKRLVKNRKILKRQAKTFIKRARKTGILPRRKITRKRRWEKWQREKQEDLRRKEKREDELS